MKAVVQTRYGAPDVLEIRQVPTPVPLDDELLVHVYCSGVNRTDCGFLRAEPFVTRLFSGLVRPKHTSLGCEFAGKVVAVGNAVKKFQVGDAVFGFDDAAFGGHAEYKRIAESAAVAKVPSGITFEQAAASAEGAHYALIYVRASKVGPGSRVLVHGATGAIGSAAVQLLKHVGAEVTATSTTRNIELIASLGADRVIDHERSNFRDCGQTFDLVFDAVGKSSFGECKGLLVPGGAYVSTELGPGGQNPLLALLGPLAKVLGAKRVLFPMAFANQEQLEFLSHLLAGGQFKPVIDRCYPLEKVRDAFEYVETGQKTGNVVLTLQ